MAGRGVLRLVAANGDLIVGDNQNPTPRPLSESEAETELLAAIGAVYGRIDPECRLRVELAALLAQLERRQARRANDRLVERAPHHRRP